MLGIAAVCAAAYEEAPGDDDQGVGRRLTLGGTTLHISSKGASKHMRACMTLTEREHYFFALSMQGHASRLRSLSW